MSRAKAGTIWTVVGFGLQNAIRLGSTLVLTRLLAPEAFGLMTLAGTILAALALMSDLGTLPSVIRSRRAGDAEFLRTAWTIQALRGLGIALVACLLAWPFSQLYDAEVLFPLTCVLAVTTLLGGFRSITVTLKQREIDLRLITLTQLGVRFTATLVTIAAAWAIGSVWALAIGAIVGSILDLLMSYILFPPFKHRFRLERAAVSEILSFGRWILFGTLATYFGGQGLLAIQGLLVPVETLGLIAISATLSWVPGQMVARVLGSVAFPKLSEVYRERPEDVDVVMRKIRLFLTFGVVPMFLLLSAIAQPLVDLLYDDRYAAAGWFLALMAVGGGLGVIAMPYQNLLLAAGDSRTHAGVMLVMALMRNLALFGGFYFGGVTGMLIGDGIAMLAIALLSMWIAWRRGYATPWLDGVAIALLLAGYAWHLVPYAVL